MISEGVVMRAKGNGDYEKIYLKLKNSVLFIFENQKMERCQNTVRLEDMQSIKIPNQDKGYFILCSTSLNRSKEMKLKCENIE